MQKKSDFEYINNVCRAICSLKEKRGRLRCGFIATAVIDEIDIEHQTTMDEEKGIDVSSSMVGYVGYSAVADSDDDKQDETTSSNDILLESFEG